MALLGIALTTAAIAQDSEPRPVEQIRDDAGSLLGFVETDLGRSFLRSAADLPEIEGERIVYWDRTKRRAIGEAEAQGLDEEALEPFRRLELGEDFYYNTAYGSPLAYCRAIDLAGSSGMRTVDGAGILDFGFGGIGHLRMLASLGANCTGLEVLDLLREFYREPGDTGEIDRASVAGAGDPGSIRLLFGRFPAEKPLTDAVGTGYDLILSKNTLKLGYIHPEREADPRSVIDLGVDDEAFVRAMFDALAPGGLFIVYNIYPKPSGPDEPYIPWASGAFPFDRALTEGVGFEVVKWNVDDSDAMRRMATILGWDGSMSLDDVFAMYTILRRPSE
ncbi:MAG: hypothetical protein H6814_09200 [Phycisphaeraceae bacterium]|nr:hypothetical protein [Phycisphaeraceae bacterium]